MATCLFPNMHIANTFPAYCIRAHLLLQLLHIMEECTAALENGGQINIIYADFEKAFDKVPHHFLLKKLQSYNLNINVSEWIRSFLCYRKQS